MSDATPPPPPAPPPAVVYRTFKRPVAKPPPVATAANAPPGAFLVELLVYNGAPFMDHWAYFVRSHGHPDIGVLIQASGDVMNGFSFDIERSHDLRIAGNYPTTRTPLQWVGGEYFGDEKSMLNGGMHRVDHAPVCLFETIVYKIKVPGKSLKNVVNSNNSSSNNIVVSAAREKQSIDRKIIHRNCQTWIVESAKQLVKERVFSEDVAAYLHAIKQWPKQKKSSSKVDHAQLELIENPYRDKYLYIERYLSVSNKRTVQWSHIAQSSPSEMAVI